MKRTVVLAHGVFDLLHVGHIEHLRQAKAMGDMLVVSLVPDAHLEKNRPVICDEAQRFAVLSACRYVDIVILCDGPGPEKVIEAIRPSIYVRGSDYIEKTPPEMEIVRRYLIQTRYTVSIPTRTTKLLERIYSMCRDHPEFQ